jgi:signal transduction histidine kinase
MTAYDDDDVADRSRTIADLEQKLRNVSAERDELFEQQAATAAILRVISGSRFDLHTVMDTIARSACLICKADLGAVSLRDGDTLTTLGVFHTDRKMADLVRPIPIKIDDQSYIGRTVLTGIPSIVPDVESDRKTNLHTFRKVLGFKSIMFVALMREGRAIGAFSLARNSERAFAQREIDLVNTFADQAVVAIENVRLFEEVRQRTDELSQSLDELRSAQNRLVQTEKLASLGQLTAGIAHEINSPIGTGLTIASSLVLRCNAFVGEQAAGSLRRSQLDAFVTGARDAANLLVANLERASELVRSFKQVAVDETAADRHSFDLGLATSQMLATLRPHLNGLDVTVETNVPDGIVMTSYPDLYGQMLSNLFVNAVVHGFAEMPRGFIRISARREADHVEIVFNDNGKGMSDEVRRLAFDPFFTTNRNQGGTGLGLHIVHNIVVQRFHGTITLDSGPGRGTTFVILVPLNAPG